MDLHRHPTIKEQHRQDALDSLTLNDEHHDHDHHDIVNITPSYNQDHHNDHNQVLHPVHNPDHHDPHSDAATNLDSYPFANLPDRLSKRFRFSALALRPEFWNRNKDKTPRVKSEPNWFQSVHNLVMSSWLNIFLIFLPVAWITNAFTDPERDKRISHIVPFIFCFLTLVPLSKLMEYGGENLSMYCGKRLGDLIEVTMSNAVEAILALVLLSECELKILQSSTIGVILLRLLLVPGISFITGGFRVSHQELQAKTADLNQSLLTTGVLALIIPVMFFGSLNDGDAALGLEDRNPVNDDIRGDLLKVSRGMSFILLAVYICSRFFLHIPLAGEENEEEEKREEKGKEREHTQKEEEEEEEEEPEMNLWVCIMSLIVTLALLAVTAQFLVTNVEPLREQINEEWFGLILLPFVSFSADGLLAIVTFIRKQFLKQKHLSSHNMAEYRPIELSIQFLMFWIPLLVILGWFLRKPATLLYDPFEVSVLVAACFLVNYVTADNKTNWAEGVMLVAMYTMIALTAFFYPGQPATEAIVQCDTVAAFIAKQAAEQAAEQLASGGGDSAATPTISSDDIAALAQVSAPPGSSLANATLSQKLQALLALYDVLINSDMEVDVKREERRAL